MKKRKELDALLLTNMNGKKLGKHSSGKEGHELLRNEASWDSNSTENDDFFSPPRKLIIRKPQKWRFCATCVPLCVFVVMVACIVVTGGLIWMHLDLKQDLDELRLRIAKVESSLGTSTEQASTVSTLQVKVEQLQNLPAQVTSIKGQIEDILSVNDQLQTRVQAVTDEINSLPTVNIDNLSQTTAQIGSKVQSMQGLQNEHTEEMKKLTASMDQLQSSLTALQGEITRVHQTTSAPASLVEPILSEPSQGKSFEAAPEHSNPDAATTLQSLQQGLDVVSSAIGKLNNSVASIQVWRQDLTPRVTALESTHSSDTHDGSLTETVAMLQMQVNSLMNSLHNETSMTDKGSQTADTLISDTQNIESRLQTIQDRLDELNPKDLNNNLLNANVTRGLQHQIERTLGKFKEENLQSVEDLQQDNQELWRRLYKQHKDIQDLDIRVQALERQSENPGITEILTKGMDSTTESTFEIESSPIDHIHPITIQGINTSQDLKVQFFMWDSDDDSFVTYKDMQDILGGSVPPEDQLMQYDKDNNGMMDLAEMKTALGFLE